MQKIYKVSGMTCEGCSKTVSQKLEKVEGVNKAIVDLAKSQVEIKTDRGIPLEELKNALLPKYELQDMERTAKAISSIPHSENQNPSKWVQLKPLFLIFTYISAAAILLNFQNGDVQSAMLDFMGLFYIVFSFFKLLDLKGFPESFSMYDPLARQLPIYGWVYPFIEVLLGLMFLMRIQVHLALIVTVVILGITTVGVIRSVLSKKRIRCACLGTALNLPMTEATIIENVIMLLMAGYMLINMSLNFR